MIDYQAFYEMADQYLIAALTLWINITECPYLFNPVAYLLRHSIELSLKAAICCEKKDYSNLSEIIINKRRIDQVHSIKILWDYYLEISNNKEFGKEFEKDVVKIDKEDFSSTKYRYPLDKQGNKLKLSPLKIDWQDEAPDISKGIPTIVIKDNQAGIFVDGIRTYQDINQLFELANALNDLNK